MKRACFIQAKNIENMDASIADLKPVAVVGAGNWICNHDTIGLRILSLVADRYGADVELCNTGSTGLALLDQLNGQELMIIVDACTFGGPPGKIYEIEADQGVELLEHPSSISIHQIGPLETLALARSLYPEKIPRRILCVFVETAEQESEAGEQVCRDVVGILDREIAQWRAEPKQIE